MPEQEKAASDAPRLCDDRWPANPNSPMFATRCRLDKGHDGAHSNGQSDWIGSLRWPHGNPPPAAQRAASSDV